MSTIAERSYTTVDKSDWPTGIWQQEPDKLQFVDVATGLPCLIVRGRSGSPCGYVGVAEGHPLFGVEYDRCPIACGEEYCDHRPESCLDVHGGITYSDFCQEGCPEESAICHIPDPGQPDHVWWFGFDTAHSGDFCPGMYRAGTSIRSYLDETLPRDWETYKDIAYVRAECAKLAGQLAALASL